MNFAYPEFLFALAAISVPIIIHLFNFRRFKRVYFSDIRFLKDVEIETKSRNQLKNLLVLLSRILAVTFLVLAFAKPVIPTGTQPAEASNSVVIYIDNSFSMSAVGESGSLLEEAKAKAIEVGSAYSNGGQIRLLTNDFEPRHFRDLSFEEFKNEVASVQSTPIVRTIDDVISRTTGMFDFPLGIGLYVISDLQENTSRPIKSISDSLLSVYTIPVQSEVGSNIYVDSCWFSSPSRLPLQEDELNVRVRNTGNSNVEKLSVKLTLNGVQRSVGTTNVSSQSYEDLKLSFTNPERGVQLAEVSLQDYPITYDDHYYLSYNLASRINILSVEGDTPSSSIAKMFDSESNFSLTQVPSNGLDYSLLNTTDLLILNQVSRFSSGMVQEIVKFARDAGNVLFISSEKLDLTSTNELLLALGTETLSNHDSAKQKVEGVNLESVLFKNVFTEWEDRIDLPAVNKYYTTESRTASNAERLLTLGNGQPLLTSYMYGNGRCYVLSSPLQDAWTNFHRHALFVPTLYNIALNSSSAGASSETIGSDGMIAITGSLDESEILVMQRANEEETFVPERVTRAEGSGIYVHGQVQKDGHFILKSEGGDTLQPVSFNYNRTESEMKYLTPEEMKEAASSVGINNFEIVDARTESLASQIQELHDGKQLWRLFLILALACLLIETILIRIL